MNADAPIADPDGTELAHDIFATVAALKALAGGTVTPIIPAMSKEVTPASEYLERAHWQPAPAEAPTRDWTKDDLRAWRLRLGIRTHVEAGALLGMTDDGYFKLEAGQRAVRPIHVLLARYVETFGRLT